MRLYTLKQVAEALQVSPQAAQKRSKMGRKSRNGDQAEAPWSVNTWRVIGNSKTAFYAFAALPADVQAAITALEVRAEKRAEIERRQSLPAPAVAPAATPQTTAVAVKTPGVLTLSGQTRKALADGELTDPQRAARDASIILCRAIDDAAHTTGRCVKTCCGELAERLLDGTALECLDRAWRASRSKPRHAGPTLGGIVRHLQRVHALYLAGCHENDPGKYLAPGRRQKEGHDPIHVRAFLKFWCSPNRPDVATVHRKGMVPWLAQQGLRAPSYSTACAIERDLPVTVKYRGRMTGSAMKALLPYIKRDVSMFKANDIWVGDGHSFKAKVQSPLHGNAFIPEVTVILDWVSRKVVGWSVALSESTIAVSDAFRDAQRRTRARPLIYYSDNGSGQTGKHIDHEITGSLARQGISHETGRPGNPQGRGVIEKLWHATAIRLAATYPTFTGKKADKETVRKIGNELARAQRAGEASPLLPPFDQFLADLETVFGEYNGTHAHRSLGGRAPDDEYRDKLDPDSLGVVSDDELACLWMPEEIRTPIRGLIQLFKNTYFLPSLVDDLAEGEQVRVRFDIHDASTVRVLRLNGTALGVAEWDGHKRAAFPVPYVEQKREERASGIKGRAQDNIDRADAELTQTYAALAEPTAAEIDLTPRVTAPAVDTVDAEYEHNKRINQKEDPDLVRWLAAHPEDMNPHRARYLLQQSDKIRPLARLIGEIGLWDALVSAAKSFEERAVVSGN